MKHVSDDEARAGRVMTYSRYSQVFATRESDLPSSS